MKTILKLSIPDKNSADGILIDFSYFPRKQIWHFMQIVGDNSHEISKSIIRENNKNIIGLSSAEYPKRVVKVYSPFLVPCLPSECPAKTDQAVRMLGLYC